ncbi:MAG: biotin/lipoyl-containing protein [Thermoplasmata archaeon]
MRIVVIRGAEREPVEIAPALDEVWVRGHRYPVTVVGTVGERVELEIGGERVLVEGWPVASPGPPGPLDVNGERWTIDIEREESSLNRTIVAPPSGRAVVSEAGSPPTAIPSVDAPAGGVPVVPPMPGKIIEIRVKEGDRVLAGQALLVLEAMKMRNEILAPVAGVVRQLRVESGSNARARDAMLYIVPG